MDEQTGRMIWYSGHDLLLSDIAGFLETFEAVLAARDPALPA